MPAGSKGKVLVAMSGGVDSSVAAAMLVRDGHEVVGCFMRLGSPGETLDDVSGVADGDASSQSCATADGASCGASRPAAPARTTSAPKAKIGHQGCCSILDAADARLVAAHLGIPFYVCNFKRDFGRIIDYFVDEYAAGRTPNPCVRCNDWLKFGKLHEYARQIGAEFVASGHYARVERVHADGAEAAGAWTLRRGIDHDKDQSYVLFGVPREQLASMLLPIGGMRKSQVRELAKAWGLPVFDKPDSQEICFVPDNDYAGLVERLRPELARSGAIVDESGQRLGEHTGQHRFTIGQRKGLSLSLGHPIYVTGRDAATNTVRVGPRERLESDACEVREANWLADPSLMHDWRPAMIKYRYNTPAAAGRVRVIPDCDSIDDNPSSNTPSGRIGRFECRFDVPQQAVAPGQALVVYDADDPDRVLGGGWIHGVRGARDRLDQA